MIKIGKVTRTKDKESSIEAYLVLKVKRLDGKAYKFSSPQNRAVPDRLCVLPGIIAFVEVKKPGKEPTPAQHRELQFAIDRGHFATWVATKDDVDNLVTIFESAIARRDNGKA